MLNVYQLSYQIGKVSILRFVDFRVEPGNLVAIIGANGAGKSTLMRLISRELTPKQGYVSWKGIPLNKYTVESLAKERAVLMQEASLTYNFPVKEVILMGRYPYFNYRPSKDDWDKVAVNMRMMGISHLGDRSYRSLSGGEKQRVQFTRVLTQLSDEKTPYLLLLDEPLNNLDIRYQHSCLMTAKAFAERGNVVLIIIHDINIAAQYADQMLLLKAGTQIAYGKPSEVMTTERISDCYDIPANIGTHPVVGSPVVYFNTQSQFNQYLK